MKQMKTSTIIFYAVVAPIALVLYIGFVGWLLS